MDRVGATEELGITRARDALIHVANGIANVVDALGSPIVDASRHSHGQIHPISFIVREDDDTAEILPGRWLYAGELWPHFGHFLFESLSRLWAYPLLSERLDGVLFVSLRGREPAGLVDGFQRQLLDLLGIELPVRAVMGDTRVEELFVPRPGSGMGHLAPGTPAFRSFVQDRLRLIPPRQDAEKIYITRSGFALRRGGYLSEDYLERALAAEGYVLYSPERETLAHQISTYLGARRIISPDCSALHLFGCVGRSDQDLAIILRRREGGRAIYDQIAAWCGRPPLIIDAIARVAHKEARSPGWTELSELDFGRVGRGLAEAGFISSPEVLPELGPRRRQWQWVKAETRFGALSGETALATDEAASSDR